MRTLRHLARLAPLTLLAACTHYDLSASITPPGTISAVAEPGGVVLHFSAVEGAFAYEIYGARVSTMTPENIDELPNAFQFSVDGSTASIPDLTVDGQPWYFMVAAHRGDGISKPTPVIAATPLELDTPLVLAAPMWEEPSITNGDQLGHALAAGDFNDDGYDDLSVASPFDDTNGADAGQFETFLGRVTGLPDQRDDFQTQIVDGSLYGYAFATGDFNCDGIDDLAVGAPFMSPSGRGVVDYYKGGPLGLDDVSQLVPVAAIATSAIGFGASLAAGDTNGDGCDDLLVGEIGRAGYAPSVHLFAGSEEGLDNPPLYSRGAEGGADLTGWGASLAIADLDGDGFSEAIVGEPLFGAQRGRFSVFLGPATIDTAPLLLQLGATDGQRAASFLANGGDPDDDGYEEILVGDFPASGPPRMFVALGGPPVLSLTFSVEIVGTADPPQTPLRALAYDVDRDGYDDVIVGDPEAPTATSASGGQITIHRGSHDGIGEVPAWTILGAPGDITFGASLAAGDFDGNRTIDIAAGAPATNNVRGIARVHSGVPTRGPRVDAGREKYLGEADYVDLTDASFFDPAPGPHACHWTFGDVAADLIENCTPEDLDTASPYWNDSGEFVVRLRVTAPDGRYGESATILHAEIP